MISVTCEDVSNAGLQSAIVRSEPLQQIRHTPCRENRIGSASTFGSRKSSPP